MCVCVCVCVCVCRCRCRCVCVCVCVCVPFVSLNSHCYELKNKPIGCYFVIAQAMREGKRGRKF